VNSALLVTAAMMFAGYAAARFRWFEPSAADVLNRFVVYVCLPGLIWKVVPGLHYEPGLWVLVLVPWLLLVLTVICVRLACEYFEWPRPVAGVLLLCVPLGNTSFLGFPMLAATLGEGAVKYAVIYDQLGTFVAFASYGVFVAAIFSGARAPSARDILQRALLSPPFIALLLAFTPLVRAPVLQPLWSRLSDALVPTVMFAVGLRLQLRPPRPLGALLLGLGLKMVAMPLIAFCVVRAISAPRIVGDVAVLEAGMPAMITAAAMAAEAGLAPGLASALAAYGVMIALITSPLCGALLRALP